jgi:hypothetical protein
MNSSGENTVLTVFLLFVTPFCTKQRRMQMKLHALKARSGFESRWLQQNSRGHSSMVEQRFINPCRRDLTCGLVLQLGGN